MSLIGKKIKYVHTEMKEGVWIEHFHMGKVLDKLNNGNSTSYLIEMDNGEIDITIPHNIKKIMTGQLEHLKK